MLGSTLLAVTGNRLRTSPPVTAFFILFLGGMIGGMPTLSSELELLASRFDATLDRCEDARDLFDIGKDIVASIRAISDRYCKPIDPELRLKHTYHVADGLEQMMLASDEASAYVHLASAGGYFIIDMILACERAREDEVERRVIEFIQRKIEIGTHVSTRELRGITIRVCLVGAKSP